jgi:hypothetical protein
MKEIKQFIGIEKSESEPPWILKKLIETMKKERERTKLLNYDNEVIQWD